MKPTAEQIDAIETTGVPVLVEAGAGTGKTWVLVQRFLHLLELHPDWPVESIVAVTFTEKAAREMRTRLRHAVEGRAAGEPENPVWQERRRGLDRLRVGTIHSLCAQILRENAIAAALDPRFDVLDERQGDLLKEDAVAQTLASLIGEQNLAAAAPIPSEALGLLESLRVDDLSGLLMDLLQSRATVEDLFARLPGVDDLMEGWRSKMAEMRRVLWEDQLHDPDFHAAFAEIPTISITAPQDKLADIVRMAQRGCVLASSGDLPGACQAWSQMLLTGGAHVAWGGKDQLAELKSMLKVLRETAKTMLAKGWLAEIGESDRQAAVSLQQWRALWGAVSGEYDRLKDAAHALDFDDLELLTRRLLAQQPRSIRLQAFLDSIQHLMVDEFQDTNHIQQEIVYNLAQSLEEGRLFVVGDAKQSIYRFRQAQVAVFNRTARDIQNASGREPVRLSCSFRTHVQLVNALNALFAVILKPAGGRPADFEARPGPLQPQRPSTGSRAPVEMLLLPDQTPDEEKKVSAEEGRLFEARQLAEKLLELHGQKFPVWDRELRDYRPFRFDDAAVLFRATTNFPLYEEQFKLAGLPYLTVSGRGYFDRPEVRDLIALLHCLYRPEDDLNLAAVLRSPLFNLSDETLYRLRMIQPGGEDGADPFSLEAIPLRQALNHPPAAGQPRELARAAAVMEELWAQVGRVQVWQLLRTALDRTGLETTLALSDRDRGSGGRQRSNIAKFMDLARQDGGASLSEFLRGLDDLRAREAREGEALAQAPESGAVQLMSIHASKGLEFPVVVVADLGRSLNTVGGTPVLLYDPVFGLVSKLRDENGDWITPGSYAWAAWLTERMEAAEDKRLLYVACTRAADLLILSGQAGGKSTWLAELLAAWNVPAAGGEDEIIQKDGFHLRVQRPVYQPDGVRRADAHPAGAAPFVMDEIPALALPLAVPPPPRSIPVTQLENLLADAAAGEEPDEESGGVTLWPAVNERKPERTRAPAAQVGRVIHRALADWDCLALEPADLSPRLEAFARREGVAPLAVPDTLRRCLQTLAELRQTGLYADICTAARRFHEVPFTLTTPVGVLHGAIDLLYQDARGGWHLVDWKSGWATGETLQEQAAQHRLQLAVYAQAAQNTLGVCPRVAVCFLSLGARVWHYRADDLEDARAQVFGQEN